MSDLQARKEINLADMKRGLIVSWDWIEEGAGKLAMDKGIRPIGRIVTREDLPHMSVRESVFGVQTLDDPHWVLSPITMLEKGRKLYLVD